MHPVIADAKRADLASFLRFDESFPGAFAGFGPTVRGVDEVEINVGEVRLREGGFDGFLDRGGQEKESTENDGKRLGSLGEKSIGLGLELTLVAS